MDGFDEIINEFLVESYESLDRLDDDLLALEDAPDDRDRLASIFRTVHTIKGTSGFLALPTLERVAHVGENLLVPLRDGEFRLTSDTASVLLEMVDAIREILGMLESGQGEGDNDYAALVERLQAALSTSKGVTPEDAAAAVADDQATEESVAEAVEAIEAVIADVIPAETGAAETQATENPTAEPEPVAEVTEQPSPAVAPTPAPAAEAPAEPSSVPAAAESAAPVPASPHTQTH
ncbi:Hpt domain-containing protein, partial [Rhodopirellula sp. MGV]|uniref:Hpt domain-containing protein n=1 Tax=Rhodopirellula sp. MGV TaxID=2023130 RepID=UPI0018E927A0